MQEEQENIEKSDTETTIFPRTEQIEFTDLMRKQSIGRQHREGNTPEIIVIGEPNLGKSAFAHVGAGVCCPGDINLSRASALAEECIRMVEVTPKVMLGMSSETSDEDILKLKENISESDAYKNPFLSESKIYDYHLSPQHVNNFEEPSDLQNLRSKNLTVEQMLEIKDSPLARQNNESQDAYKIRRKLQKTIIKHRNILFK